MFSGISALLLALTTAPDGVEQAFSFMQDHQAAECSFTRLHENGDSSSLERYEAVSGTWTLLKVDDRTPSDKELRKFSGNAEDRKDRTLPTSMDFAALAVSDSFRFIVDTEQGTLYEFTPQLDPDEEKKIAGALLGKVLIDKQTRGVAWFEVSNTRSFSPATGISIQNMHQHFEYQWLADQSVFVIKSVSTKVSGKAFGLKKIAQDETVTFTDFSCS